MEGVPADYFDALARRDADAMAALWAPDGVDHIAGQVDARGPAGVRAYFEELFAAFPDLATTVRSAVTEGDRTAVHWTATGTHLGPLWGVAPTGRRVELEGIDLLDVRAGLIVRNEALADAMSVARQVGLLPTAGSGTEDRLFSAFNARTRALRRAGAQRDLEPVADGVWLLRGGLPRTMNVFLLEDEGGGVTLFDAGVPTMSGALAEAAAPLGGINRIVLGHADADHRGGAPALHVPVYCHPRDKTAAESDESIRPYMHLDRLPVHGRLAYPHLLRFWDGGAVQIAGTVEEGDEVSGFRVVHLPGHAPGMIGLWRERDRLALTSDCFYMVDVFSGREVPPRVPHPAFNEDEQQARESIRRLAALEPAMAWPGHRGPLTGDVRSQLEAIV
jgi:steroid delta-isomerase-like uncharacterized protein